MPCKHDINFLTRDITARQTRRIVRGGRESRQYTRHLRGKRRMSCAGALTNSRDAVSKAATVPTRRTSDQAISIGAHIHAHTTAWHARGRRSITVVVRDERPLCATRHSIFDARTALLGRYIRLLVRWDGRGITLSKCRNESRYFGAARLYFRGSHELTRAFSSHKVSRLPHVGAAYRMSNVGGRVFAGYPLQCLHFQSSTQHLCRMSRRVLTFLVSEAAFLPNVSADSYIFGLRGITFAECLS